MSDLFISYAREDRPQAESLAKVLTRSGWSVWWDRQIPIGKTFAQVIEEQIHAAKCVIVLWSKAAVKSGWVQNEAAEGQQRGILAPVFIDDVPIPFEFRRIQAARLVDWHGEPDSIEFRALREAIERITGRRPPLGEEPPRTGEGTSQTEVGIEGGEKHEQTEDLRPEQNRSQIVHPFLTLTGDNLSQKLASSAREEGEGESTHLISKEREYTQAFLTLLASTLVILAGTVILFAVVPTCIGQNRGADWRDFLPWMPGMGVAMIAGTLGAFSGGLLQIWLQVTGVKNSDDAGGQVNELSYGLRPVLGAIVGTLVFLLYAASWLGDLQAASLGQLIWRLTPYTVRALAIYVVVAFTAGLSFPRISGVLEKVVSYGKVGVAG